MSGNYWEFWSKTLTWELDREDRLSLESCLDSFNATLLAADLLTIFGDLMVTEAVVDEALATGLVTSFLAFGVCDEMALLLSSIAFLLSPVLIWAMVLLLILSDILLRSSPNRLTAIWSILMSSESHRPVVALVVSSVSCKVIDSSPNLVNAMPAALKISPTLVADDPDMAHSCSHATTADVQQIPTLEPHFCRLFWRSMDCRLFWHQMCDTFVAISLTFVAIDHKLSVNYNQYFVKQNK